MNSVSLSFLMENGQLLVSRLRCKKRVACSSMTSTRISSWRCPALASFTCTLPKSEILNGDDLFRA